MLIRPALASDAASIASLYVRTRRLAYAHFFPADYLAAMSVPDYTQTWIERISDAESGMETFVAEPDQGLSGFTHCGTHDELENDTGEIVFMYVAPEYQRGGLGTQLMEKAVST